MKIRNKLYGISLLSLLLSVAACTSETEEIKTPDPIPSEDVGRRDVLLTLKNQLSIVPTKSGGIQTTKAGDEIATAAENKISALDIYVFGSKTENGVYTYQERFCYRENSSELPFGSDVTALDLTAKGSEGKETTALLSLKKGLFVKLYCIANQGKLIDPATGAVYTDFVPLYQSNPGQASNMVTDGKPKEEDFKLLQSTQLDPALTTDILLTPLPMTGAYATPLDLTDFSVSARLQLGFRLTRAVARFDVVNDTSTSKFTIESVSMANGRKGVSFFPLTVIGKLPDADAGDLITYPARKFDGTDANAGISTGAFYTWPSPVQDGGYLILSGTYAANKTDNVPVTYKIPFKPSGSETGNYIEVSQNHRYTVEITKADEYHLDFTLDVADWTDDGSIDDYEPGGDTDKDGMKVQITDVNGSYDKTTRTVTMAITDDAQFAIEGGSTSGYYTTMYYENMDTEHQWLTMDPPADNITKADAISSIFTIKKNAEYKDTKFPIATIRFTDKITAKETVVIVEPIANPVVKGISYTDGSSFTDNEVLLNKTAAIADPSVTVSVFASGGSKLENVPDWLKVSPANSQTLSNAQYTFTANVSDGSFPNPFPAAGVTITAKNMGDQTKTQDITIKMKSNVTVSCAKEGQAEYDESKKVIHLYNDNNAKVTLTINAIGGTDLVETLPGWLTATKSGEGNNTTTYTLNVANNGQTNVNQKITFKSKIDNSIVSAEYMLYSIPKELVLSNFKSYNSYSKVDDLSNSTPVFTFFPSANSYCEFVVTSPKGITLNSSTSNWAYMEITKESTLSSGAHQSTIRLKRKPSNSDATYNNLNFGQLSATITNKYTGQSSKTLTIKQSQEGIIYPGSDIPAYTVDGNSSYWIGSIDAATQKNYSETVSLQNTVCPAGWKVPNVSDIRSITKQSDEDNSCKPFNTPLGRQIQKAFTGATGDEWYYMALGDAYGYGLLVGNNPRQNGYSIWSFGQILKGSIRCIKNK